jgi:Caudovirus prohead serine protease
VPTSLETTQLGALTRLVNDSPTVDVESRVIRFAFSSTAPVERYAWFDTELPEGASYRFDEVLSHEKRHWRLDRVKNNVAPYLKNHDRNQKLGQVQKVEFDGDVGYATVKLRRTADADQFLLDVEDKTAGGTSFGYIVHKYRVVEPAEYEDTPNGRKLKKKAVLEGVDVELLEVSSEEIPADASVSSPTRSIDFRSIAIDGNPNFPPISHKTDMPTIEELQGQLTESQRQLTDVQSNLTTLRTELDSARTELRTAQELIRSKDGEIETLKKGSQLTVKYTALRQVADALIADAKISKPEYQKLFGESVETDLQSFTEERAGKIEFALDLYKDRAPQLNTELKTGKEEIPDAPPAKSERTAAETDADAERIAKLAQHQKVAI